MKRATDHLEPSAKRRQDRQGRKGDEENSDDEDTGPGQFAKADAEVLKTRRIIKARRGNSGLASSNAPGSDGGVQGAQSAAAGSSSPAREAAPKAANPFAGISLLAPAATVETSQANDPASAHPAKAELGSKDAVTAAGDSKDDAASSPPFKIDMAAEQANSKVLLQLPKDNVVNASKISRSPAAAKDSTSAGTAANVEAKVAGSPQPAAVEPAAADSVTGETSGTEKRTSSPEAAIGTGVSLEPTTKASEGFTFGSSLAAKNSASGFGALAGANCKNPAFGFGAPPVSSEGSTPGAAIPAFQGFNTQSKSDGGDCPSAQKLFGDKSTAPATTLLLGSPAGKGNDSEEVVVTGEEDEQTVWSGDGTLFEFGTEGWKERGRGQARVKVATAAGQGRIIMRQRGNLRLLLNANLWPDMAVNTMDGGMGVTFAVHNAAADTPKPEDSSAPNENGAKMKMATYAFRTKVRQTLTELTAAVNVHKGSCA